MPVVKTHVCEKYALKICILQTDALLYVSRTLLMVENLEDLEVSLLHFPHEEGHEALPSFQSDRQRKTDKQLLLIIL